jgi:3-phosphoshikimate 1-carboxyvinyltransferase
VLAGSGASVMVKDGVIKVNKSMGLSAFRYDATDTPDLFPPLAVLASHASGTSEIKGIHRLHGKESDRAKSITAMLDALGVSSFIADDTLFVKGGDVRGGNVDSAGDHRIAMAAAVAGLGAREKVTVKNTDPVNKSYPSFFDALKSLGASVTLTGEKQIS